MFLLDGTNRPLNNIQLKEYNYGPNLHGLIHKTNSCAEIEAN